MSYRNNILYSSSEGFNLSTNDFEFFMHVAVHQKLTVPVANQLIQIALDVSRKNIIFTRISLKLLMTLLNRFENNT